MFSENAICSLRSQLAFYWILGRTFQSWGFATRRFSPKNLEPGKTTGQLAGSGFAKQRVPLSLTDGGKMASPPKSSTCSTSFCFFWGSLSSKETNTFPGKDHISPTFQRHLWFGDFPNFPFFGGIWINPFPGGLTPSKMSSAAQLLFPHITRPQNLKPSPLPEAPSDLRRITLHGVTKETLLHPFRTNQEIPFFVYIQTSQSPWRIHGTGILTYY